MLKRSASTLITLSEMTLGLGNSASVFGQPNCVPVQGKITNTFIALDGSRTRLGLRSPKEWRQAQVRIGRPGAGGPTPTRLGPQAACRYS